jgi:hypothetical protein
MHWIILKITTKNAAHVDTADTADTADTVDVVDLQVPLVMMESMD